MKNPLFKPGCFFIGLLLTALVCAAQPVEEKHIGAALIHSLYVDPDGNVWVWGGSSLSGVDNESVPHLVMKDGKSVYAPPSDSLSYVIKQDGSLWGWGRTNYGQMGVIRSESRTTSEFIVNPRKIMDQVKSVSGNGTIFAVKPDNSLWGWGEAGPQRGDTVKENLPHPRKVMKDIILVSTTAFHTVVKKTDGTLWAWGNNQCGALGTGDRKDHVHPVKVDMKPLGKRKIVQIDTRWGETYLLADDGTVWYSGEYNIHQDECLDPPHLVPTKLDTIDNVKAIALGQFHELFLKKDGSVWASGYAEGASSSLWTVPKGPGKVMDGVAEIAAGQFHSIALKKDGTVWTWGVNEHGQLGDGTNQTTTTPVQVHFPTP